MPTREPTRSARIETKLDHAVEILTTLHAQCGICRPIVLGDEAHKPIAERLENLETRAGVASRALWLSLGGLATLLATLGGPWIARCCGL
jgi:hypothetical protein